MTGDVAALETVAIDAGSEIAGEAVGVGLQEAGVADPLAGLAGSITDSVTNTAVSDAVGLTDPNVLPSITEQQAAAVAAEVPV